MALLAGTAVVFCALALHYRFLGPPLDLKEKSLSMFPDTVDYLSRLLWQRLRWYQVTFVPYSHAGGLVLGNSLRPGLLPYHYALVAIGCFTFPFFLGLMAVRAGCGALGRSSWRSALAAAGLSLVGSLAIFPSVWVFGESHSWDRSEFKFYVKPPDIEYPVLCGGYDWELTGETLRDEAPAILAAWLPVALIMLASVRWPRRLDCRRCHYSLVGNTSGTCPECGHVIPQETATEIEQISRRASASGE